MSFSIEKVNDNGFSGFVLKNPANNCYAAVLPSCGAILHAFVIRHNGQLLNVIDHYENADDFKMNCTSKGFRGCKLSPFVCRLKKGQYHFGGNDLTIRKFYLGNHALHGLLYDAEFEVIDQGAGETNAFVSMKHEYRATDAGYPFHYDCTVTYMLEEGNKLSVITGLINNSEIPIPVADGWHPYFTLGGKVNELRMEFQSREILEFDKELVPTGKLVPFTTYGSLKDIGEASFDNCYTLDFTKKQPLFVLQDPIKKIQVGVCPDRSYPYLQIYTPPHRQSIAIENLSAAPDSFNNGMGTLILEPGASASFKTTYCISSLT